MGRKTSPFEHYPAWTTARFWTFIRSALRQAHVKWPPAQNVMKEGRKELTKEEQKERGVRHKYEHQCSDCKQWFPQKDIEKDHIVPTGSLKTFEDLPGFVARMFVSEEGYRKLCRECHKAITAAERAAKRGK